MTMLGAQLDDLDGLAQRLRITAGDIGTAQGDARTTTTTVVGSVRESAGAARMTIETAMQTLLASVAGSARTAEAANWTGQNQAAFLGHHADFSAAMDRAGAATNDAFGRFADAIEQMSAALEEYEVSLAASLTDATASAESMAGAVDAQRANLDLVMNTGLAG